MIKNFFQNLDKGGHFGKQNGFRKHENIAIFKKASIHKTKNGRLMIFCRYLNRCYFSVTSERFCCHPSHQEVIKSLILTRIKNPVGSCKSFAGTNSSLNIQILS